MLPQDQIDPLISVFLDTVNDGAGSLTRLFQNDYTPSALSVIGDLVEADFPGYAAAGPQTDWATLVDADTGLHGVGNTDLANFTATSGAGLPQAIYGWYVTADGGALLSAIRFPTPVVINDGETFAMRRFIPFNSAITPV